MPSCTRQHAQFASVLRALRGVTVRSVQSRSRPLGEAPPLKRFASLYPRGPRSGEGYVVHAPSSLNRPHPSHLQTHRDFAALQLIPGAFAGRYSPRPASGSVLSLRVPSRHAILYDPGELIGDIHPVASPTTLAFADRADGSALSMSPTIRFRWGGAFRGFSGSRSLRPVELLASLADRTGSPQPQRRLRPGFQRVGHPSRCRISLQWHLGLLHWRDFHPLELQLASLHTPSAPLADTPRFRRTAAYTRCLRWALST